MTIRDEIQTSIRQHARGRRLLGGEHRAAAGAGSGIVLPEGWMLTNARNVRGADERTVLVAFTLEIEGK